MALAITAVASTAADATRAAASTGAVGHETVSYAFVVLTMAMIVRNSWVDATGDITAAVRADRRSLAVLTGLYLLVATGLMVQTLT